MVIKKGRELLHMEKELDRYPNRRLPNRQEVHQEHELTHIPYRSWSVHFVRGAGMRIADEQDKMRKEENNTLQLGASTTRS